MEQPQAPQPNRQPQSSGRAPLLERSQRAFGPLAGGMILDLVDLSTFGPYGVGGFFVGCLVGWWICSIYSISRMTRLTLALLSGIYCLLPLTEFVPLATLLSAFVRFRGSDTSG